MNNMEPIAQILWRYVKALELTLEERRELNQWLGKSVANKILFDELSDRELWQQSVAAEFQNVSEGSRERIKKRLKKMRYRPYWLPFLRWFKH